MPPGRRFCRQAATLEYLTRPTHGNIVTQMKTTIDIADDLLLRAKQQARSSHTTLRSLIEEA
jgi:hypothetical protein